MPRITALALLVCAGLSASAYADIFQWTDASGAVHFSDTPPEQGGHRALDMKPTVTVPMHENLGQSERVQRSREAVGAMLQSRNGTEKTSPPKADDGQCERLNAALARIQNRLRAGYDNDKGNRLRARRRGLSQQYSRRCVLN